MKHTIAAKRSAGAAVPLSGIKVDGGWCVGEYPDLVPFADFCRAGGLDTVQVLPLNDSGRQSSPYAALSAFALHPLYLRVADIPEAAGCPAVLQELDDYAAACNGQAFFNYYEAYDRKMAALEAVYAGVADSLAADKAIHAFVAGHDWLRTYAVYKRLKKQQGDRSWRDWPSYSYPTKAAIDALWKDAKLQREHYFYVWLQYHCALQLQKAADALKAMQIGLLGDLPILMNDDSADVWAERQLFLMDLRAGAPPEGDADRGQNWGFPVYNWESMAANGYNFWKQRIKEAAKYYSSYRIDHVLGFFRIWAMPEAEQDGYLGFYFPGFSISTQEFAKAGFAEDRLRWLSQPHLRGPELRIVLAAYGIGLEALLLPADSAPFASVRTKAGAAAAKGLPLLTQLPGEDLYLFNPLLGGAAWFDACGLPPEVAAWLKTRWRDRSLLPLAGGSYVPIYRFWAGTAWQTLSWEEKQRLESLFHAKSQANDQLWAERGRTILSVLTEASDMLPCAEDLGAIPPCVPRVLQELGILGLRIPRWTRYYDRPGAPYIPAHEYPQLSVCALSVHDTSTLRAWWELEDGRADFARAFLPESGQPDQNLSPDTQLQLMSALGRSNSAIFMAQLQDYTDLVAELRSADPSADRVNVPGTLQDSNWTWRMRQSVQQLSAGKKLLERIKQISRRS